MLPRSSSEFSALRGRRHSVTPGSLCRPMGFHGTGAASIGALQTGNIRTRVRIFIDPVASVVGERVSYWLENEVGDAQIVKDGNGSRRRCAGEERQVASICCHHDLVRTVEDGVRSSAVQRCATAAPCENTCIGPPVAFSASGFLRHGELALAAGAATCLRPAPCRHGCRVPSQLISVAPVPRRSSPRGASLHAGL